MRYSPGPNAELFSVNRSSRFESVDTRCSSSTRPTSTLSMVTANTLKSEYTTGR